MRCLFSQQVTFQCQKSPHLIFKPWWGSGKYYLKSKTTLGIALQPGSYQKSWELELLNKKNISTFILLLTLYHFLLTGMDPTWGHSPQRMICWFLDQGQVHPPLTKRNYYNDNWKSVVITHTFWATAVSVNIYGAMITWYCCTKLINLLHRS